MKYFKVIQNFNTTFNLYTVFVLLLFVKQNENIFKDCQFDTTFKKYLVIPNHKTVSLNIFQVQHD